MIRFRSRQLHTVMLDPRDGFAKKVVDHEVRYDPLTGATCRMAHFGLPARQAANFPYGVDPVEESKGLEKGSSSHCPFCPPLVEQVTPKFPPGQVPEGRLKRGDSVLFPNLSPYGQHSPVAAIGRHHLVGAADIDANDLADALCLMAQFYSMLPPKERQGVMGWNFFPPAGASLIHPHLQGVAARVSPSSLASEERAIARHHKRYGTSFFDELLEAERDGPRWIGSFGRWSCGVSFAPVALLPDLWLVAQSARGVTHLAGAKEDVLIELAEAVASLSAALSKIGIASWNLVVKPTASTGTPGSTLRVAMIPRFHPLERYASSDLTWIPFGTGEAVCTEMPESWAKSLREVI
ncbi:MAG: hypothetical protein M1131_06040 [Actinobacteria bacterium]|nr:hypothetical protein [Actinomycetota bacterium]MCL6094737.1 hypothetical protein [Actinomycetota bacterium]